MFREVEGDSAPKTPIIGVVYFALPEKIGEDTHSPVILCEQGRAKTYCQQQPDHEALVDTAAENPLEAAAKENGLNYVKLDGQVGIIGNGAGLVMSTLDVVAYAGEKYNVKPANFLDIGGGASAQVMADGLSIILGDSDVRSVFVNVFGGITACDAVATFWLWLAQCSPL